MLESVIFYSKKTGDTYFEIGKNNLSKKFNNFALGEIFHSMHLNESEINGKYFHAKSSGNDVAAVSGKYTLTDISNNDYGLIGVINVEPHNIFLNTLNEIYSLIYDNSIIHSYDYNDEIMGLVNGMFNKLKKKSVFINARINSLRSDFKSFSGAMLSYLKEEFDQGFVDLSKELFSQNYQFIQNYVKNKGKLDFIISCNNSFSNKKISVNSSLIIDYGKLCQIFDSFMSIKHIFSPLIYNHYIIDEISERFNFDNSFMSEFGQAIKESFEINYLERTDSIALSDAYKI